ncbi:hypothetical protein JG687_00018329, partial [Phytophthora cactorum]
MPVDSLAPASTAMARFPHGRRVHTSSLVSVVAESSTSATRPTASSFKVSSAASTKATSSSAVTLIQVLATVARWSIRIFTRLHATVRGHRTSCIVRQLVVLRPDLLSRRGEEAVAYQSVPEAESEMSELVRRTDRSTATSGHVGVLAGRDDVNTGDEPSCGVRDVGGDMCERVVQERCGGRTPVLEHDVPQCPLSARFSMLGGDNHEEMQTNLCGVSVTASGDMTTSVDESAKDSATVSSRVELEGTVTGDVE